MNASILALGVDGYAMWAHLEPHMRRPLRSYVLDSALSFRQQWIPPSGHEAVVACVTRARTACAVAHEHARRLVASYERGEMNDALCRHGDTHAYCWPCYVAEQEAR